MELCGGGHGPAAGAFRSGKAAAAHPGAGRRYRRPAGHDRGQPAACPERGAAVRAAGENLDDLFQVGCIGLIKAIDNFDPAQPVRFSTYGVPMIIGGRSGASCGTTTPCGSAAACAMPPTRPCRPGRRWKSSWAGSPLWTRWPGRQDFPAGR